MATSSSLLDCPIRGVESTDYDLRNDNMRQSQSGSGPATLEDKPIMATSSGSHLLNLPLELRLQIYAEALVVGRVAIYTSSARQDQDGEQRHSTGARHLGPPCLALLMTCKSVCEDAAHIFYSKNIFDFRRSHEYKREVAWLLQIGPANRASLRRLKIAFRVPSVVWQLPDGTREGLESYYMTFDKCHARHPLLQKPLGTWTQEKSEHWEEGIVNDIDPDLEATFSLLGNVSSVRRVKVTLYHVDFLEHGDRCDEEPNHGWKNVAYPTNYPNLVEAWCTLYSKHRQIKVVWRDSSPKEKGEEMRQHYQNVGWSVIRSVDCVHRTFFYLRWKPYEGAPIVADLPMCPDWDETGRPAYDRAADGLNRLWLCKMYGIHRDGDECSCTKTVPNYPATSMVLPYPVWPRMPE